MARSHSRSPKVSLSSSVGRVRVHSPSLRRKSVSNCVENDDQEVEFLGNGNAENVINKEAAGTEFGVGNKVMVVVDSSMEAKGALEWALSHTIQGQDTIVLLHVIKPRKRESNRKRNNQRAYELLHSMKNLCQKKRPGVQVEVAKVEGKEKGPIIVEAAKQQKVSLLVIGQRKRSMIWRLMRRWAGKRGGGGGVVDYCIQNASCMTVAVRRKSNELGGYLITTKRHKKFWLLA